MYIRRRSASSGSWIESGVSGRVTARRFRPLRNERESIERGAAQHIRRSSLRRHAKERTAHRRRNARRSRSSRRGGALAARRLGPRAHAGRDRGQRGRLRRRDAADERRVERLARGTIEQATMAVVSRTDLVAAPPLSETVACVLAAGWREGVRILCKVGWDVRVDIGVLDRDGNNALRRATTDDVRDELIRVGELRALNAFKVCTRDMASRIDPSRESSPRESSPPRQGVECVVQGVHSRYGVSHRSIERVVSPTTGCRMRSRPLHNSRYHRTVECCDASFTTHRTIV